MDSASTPEQLGRLLDDVKEAGAKRVLLVFGCPGSTSKEHRAAMMRVGGRVGGWMDEGAGELLLLSSSTCCLVDEGCWLVRR